MACPAETKECTPSPPAIDSWCIVTSYLDDAAHLNGCGSPLVYNLKTSAKVRAARGRWRVELASAARFPIGTSIIMREQSGFSVEHRVQHGDRLCSFVVTGDGPDPAAGQCAYANGALPDTIQVWIGTKPAPGWAVALKFTPLT